MYRFGSFWPLSFRKGINEFLIKEGTDEIRNYRVNKNLEIRPCALEDSCYLFGNIIINNLGPKVSAFNIDSGKELWRLDVSGYDTTRWSSEYGDGSNSIDGSMFNWQNLVMIPMASGDLLAVNALNGKLEWITEEAHSALFDCIYGNTIYAMNNVVSRMYSIDVQTGKKIAQRDYSEIVEKKYSTGFEGKLIVCDNMLFVRFFKDGLLAIVDRYSLELQEIVELPGVFMGIDAGNIIWHNKRLYILDPISHILHVLE
jgi:outer membrane protein assembly factor BamB